MYDIDRLHKFLENPVSERCSGKTVSNCFYVAGLIDICDERTIAIVLEDRVKCWFFQDELVHVLKYLEIETDIRSDLSILVKDVNNITKTVMITTPQNKEKLLGVGIVLHIDNENSENCYLA